MGVFHKIRVACARFMYGRNGVDQLGVASVWACLIVQLLSSLLSKKWETLGVVVYYLSMLLWLWLIFRIFSKNLYKRREENRKWMQFWGGIKSKNAGIRARHADKEHKYFTCKNCKAICRVPAGKGEIIITCPKCGTQIRGKS